MKSLILDRFGKEIALMITVLCTFATNAQNCWNIKLETVTSTLGTADKCTIAVAHTPHCPPLFYENRLNICDYKYTNVVVGYGRDPSFTQIFTDNATNYLVPPCGQQEIFEGQASFTGFLDPNSDYTDTYINGVGWQYGGTDDLLASAFDSAINTNIVMTIVATSSDHIQWKYNGTITINNSTRTWDMTEDEYLSGPQTDETLRKKVANACSYNGQEWVVGVSTAYYTLSNNHTHGAGCNFKFRITIENTSVDLTYNVNYYLIYQPPNVTKTFTKKQTWHVDGNGGTVSMEKEIKMPSWVGTPCVNGVVQDGTAAMTIDEKIEVTTVAKKAL